MTATVGETVTLRCFCGEDSVTFFSWYQQILGSKPVIISSRMRHNTKATVNTKFQGRFEVESKEKINHLTISDVRPSDSATYYCGILEFNSLEFGEGTLLQVRMPLSNVQAVVYQSALNPVEPGDSVHLTCEVHSEKCEEKQSLYWLRYTPSQPGLIYPNEGTCVNEANIRKCALTFSINSVNSSDEGIYYCALASCGEVVLGNGTEVQLKSKFFAKPATTFLERDLKRRLFFSSLMCLRKQSSASACVLLECCVGSFHHPTLRLGFHSTHVAKPNMLCL